jgi:hypothetical protein
MAKVSGLLVAPCPLLSCRAEECHLELRFRSAGLDVNHRERGRLYITRRRN